MSRLILCRVAMWLLFWLLQFLPLMPPVAASDISSGLCRSKEIRKMSDFAQLSNCSVIVGHVRIIDLQLPSHVNLSQIQSEVTEITDYLLIYRTIGVLTAEDIFPKLRLIRGQRLLFDQYGLVVYENRNLRELGLVKLLRIQHGDIRIEANPMLCFVETVDWVYLMGNSTQQHFSVKNNKSPNHCPVCGGLSADYSSRYNQTSNCWNTHSSQMRHTRPRTQGCSASCERDGCDTMGNCCHHNCIEGCSSQNCTLCSNYQRGERCVDKCIASFELNRRQCISVKECRQLKLIPLTSGYRCLDQCPVNHKPVLDANGMMQCQLECAGVFHVKRVADLDLLQDCVTINGSLIIELVDIKEKVVQPLEQTLGNIKEITGYLKVMHSNQLMSLTFLKNLDTIRGDILLENKYALSVFNNYHLEHIWPTNRQVAIQQGTIFFHLNPRLCYDKILKLQPSLKSVRKISIADVSPNSNGERVICGDLVQSLNATVEDVNSTAVRIVLDYMKSDNMESLIGYSYHYMEAPQRNVTMYDGRHGCGHDNWLMDVTPNKSRRHIISKLKPYTQYAYFVKTLTRTDYHMQMDAYSNIQYFRTLPSKPSPVSRLFGDSEQSTQITVHWWPPRRPNGNITRYVLSYEMRNVSKPESMKNYDNSKPFDEDELDCLCNDVEPYYSGSQPEDENYYNKEQTTYEDAIPDLIYVKRDDPEEMDGFIFSKIRKFGDLYNGATTNVTSDSTTTNSTSDSAISTTTDSSAETTTKSIRSVDGNATVTKDSERSNKTEAQKDAARQYELFRMAVEDKSRVIQDIASEDYTIFHELPKCQDANATVEYRLTHKCVVEEEVTGISLSSTAHTYNLTNLKPNWQYSISIRACVEGVVNGCSNPTTIHVDTISVELETFMNSNL